MALTVVTEPAPDFGPLIPLLEAQRPLLFTRRGDGIAGFGAALRLEFAGSTRLADAASTWREIVAAAAVTDPVRRPGSGLVAFGSFAFADASAATSLLIVPSMILGRRDGVCWVTRVDSGEPVPGATALGAEARAVLRTGTMTPEAFMAAVAAGVQRIGASRLRKVVLARDLVGSLPADADHRHPLARLAAAYPDTSTFAIDGLIGSSPETLVRVKGGALTARVLAGTTARGADAAADESARAGLATSAKDLDEHGYAVASVRATLGPHSRDLQFSQAPYPLALPNLWHLATEVSGSLHDGSSALDLVASLHPTAAVAGHPTDLALSAIADLEPFDRGRYAGPVGWVDAGGDGEWALALRCAQLSADGSVTAYAGAGIVAGSDPERELAETSLKLRPMLEAIGS